MRKLAVFLIVIVFLSLPVLAADYFGNVNLKYILLGLRCNITSITKTIQQGQSSTEAIGVWESNSSFPNTYYANFSGRGDTGDWASFNPNPVLVNNTTVNSTTATITVPSSQPIGAYGGYVLANSTPSNRGNCTISLIVDVTAPPTPPTPSTPPSGGIAFPTQQIVLDTDIEIAAGSDQVTPRERVYAQITIVKAGGYGVVNVNLTYWIKDPDGRQVDYKKTTIGVDNIRSDIYFLTLPPDALLGIYTFNVKTTYGSIFDEADATFQVVRILPPAVLDIKEINVPLMFTDREETITVNLENTGDDPLIVNTTFFLPEGFEPKEVYDSKPIEAESGELFFAQATPRVFGLYRGFISIKYDGKGLTREFNILVLPTYLLLIPLIVIILIIIIWRKRKREKTYIRRERISHIRRMIGK